MIPLQRAPDGENGVRSILSKQASERHIGTGKGDGMTGAPVIELEYKPCIMHCRT